MKAIEADYDGVRTGMNHDPFFPLLLAAEREKLEIASSIAVAFARGPMNLANIGHDLNAYSKGRFCGIGVQIKPHKRFRALGWTRRTNAQLCALCHLGELV